MDNEDEELGGITKEQIPEIVEFWFKGMKKVWKAEKAFMDSVTRSAEDDDVRHA